MVSRRPPYPYGYFFSSLRFLPATQPPPLSVSRDSPAYRAMPASPVLGDLAAPVVPPVVPGIVVPGVVVPLPDSTGITVFSLRLKWQTVHSSCFDPVWVVVAAWSTFHTKVWEASSVALARGSGQVPSVH